MRAIVILIGSLFVVLSGCAQLNTSARFPGGNPFPTRSQSVELGEPSPNGFGAPAAAPDASAAPGGPVFEGPAFPNPGNEGRRNPARGGRPSKLTKVDRTATFWTASYQSTRRRSINALRAGTGPRKIMLVGSLHGNEPLAVALIDRLAKHARDRSRQWDGGTVLFVRTPNPDGLAAGTRTNSRGVDLNRNFPTGNFRPNRQQRTGPRPGSEIETQGILRLLYAYRPRRIVHLKTTTDKTGWVLYSRSSRAVVRQFSDRTNLRLGELPAGAIAGSLENYVADILGMEQITIAVPVGSGADADALWRDYGDVLLTALGAIDDSPHSVPREDPHELSPHVAGNPKAAGTAESETKGVPRIGYFELSPPPEEDSNDGT